MYLYFVTAKELRTRSKRCKVNHDPNLPSCPTMIEWRSRLDGSIGLIPFIHPIFTVSDIASVPRQQHITAYSAHVS